MAVWVCRRCNHEESAPWESECPGCKGFYRAMKVGAESAEQSGATTMGGGRVKSGHRYLSTGQPGIDKVLGGGLVVGRVVLFGGFAGTGKSRTLLMVADYIGKTQGKVIYASGEESTDQVNDMCADLGLRNDQVIIMGNQCSVEKVIEHAKKVKAFLAIYDSAQKFMTSGSSGTPGSGAQCKAIGEMIKDYCGESKTCAIIINQMSGTGDLKGGTELEHHCDTVMVLAYPKDDDEDAPPGTGIRVLAGSKNRIGPENVKTYWQMTDEGVLEHVPARSKLLELPRRGKYSKRSSEDVRED